MTAPGQKATLHPEKLAAVFEQGDARAAAAIGEQIPPHL